MYVGSRMNARSECVYKDWLWRQWRVIILIRANSWKTIKISYNICKNTSKTSYPNFLAIKNSLIFYWTEHKIEHKILNTTYGPKICILLKWGWIVVHVCDCYGQYGWCWCHTRRIISIDLYKLCEYKNVNR